MSCFFLVVLFIMFTLSEVVILACCRLAWKKLMQNM